MILTSTDGATLTSAALPVTLLKVQIMKKVKSRKSYTDFQTFHIHYTDISDWNENFLT